MPDLLRETFEAYAPLAPSADGLRDAVDARVRRGRRRRMLGLGAVVTAAAVVAGFAVVSGERRPGPPATVVVTEEPPPRLFAEDPAPPGTKWAVGKGVAVAAPVAWFDATYDSCGTPLTDAVILWHPPEQGDCVPFGEDPISVVRFGVPSLEEWFRPGAESRDVVVSGVPGRRVSGTVNLLEVRQGQYGELLVVPGNDVAVLVTSPDPEVVRRVLDTATVRQGTDQRGCAINVASLDPPRDAAREGAGGRLVPGTPVQASVCRYRGPRSLLASALVTDDVTSLAATMNALPPGGRPLVPGRFPGLWVVTFRYAEGPDVVVHVLRESKEAVGVTNGALLRAVSPALGEAFRPLVGWNADWDEKAVDWG